MSDHGVFPFGQPNTERPPRRAVASPKVFVLGVYPSALHVAWKAPDLRDRDGFKSSGVAALAVDVEPETFWDGARQDANQLVDAWIARTGFREIWGRIGPSSQNGSSGRKVRDEVLRPLGIRADEAWMSDCINWYFVKHGGRDGRRQQGDAIDQEYTPFARRLGLPTCVLPQRPAPRALVRLAVTEHRERLLQEIHDSKSQLLITLGEEARQVVVSLSSNVDCDDPPFCALSASDENYGQPGVARIGGQSLEWMALTHPGNSARHWSVARRAWLERVASRR